MKIQRSWTGRAYPADYSTDKQLLDQLCAAPAGCGKFSSLVFYPAARTKASLGNTWTVSILSTI